jgi:hypothetical protein
VACCCERGDETSSPRATESGITLLLQLRVHLILHMKSQGRTSNATCSMCTHLYQDSDQLSDKMKDTHFHLRNLNKYRLLRNISVAYL